MPIPFALAAAGIGLGASIFGHHNKQPKMPQYFYNNPQELLPLIRQSVQSGYGGAGEMLREELANAGLFQSGAYPSEMGKLAASRGQEESQAQTSFLTDSYKMERGAELGFQHDQYFDQLGANRQADSDLQSAIGGFGSALGNYQANKDSQKHQDELINLILGRK